MKKSKILIPALAVIGISLAASATATVAWFSATRARTVALEDVYAVDTSENLTVTLTAVTASTVTGSTVKLDPLRDASLDITSMYNVDTTDKNNNGTENEEGDVDGPLQHVYAPNRDGNNDITSYYNPTANDTGKTVTVNDVSKHVYYYASFKMEFAIKDSTSQNYELLFDKTAASKITQAVTDTYTKAVSSSLRVGFKEVTSTNADGQDNIVWGGNYNTDTETDANNTNEAVNGTSTGPKYVNGTTTTSTAKYFNAYTPGTTGYTSSLFSDNQKTLGEIANEKNYMGKLCGLDDTDNDPIKQTYYAYVWFEGEDYFCKSTETTTEVSKALAATLRFYAVKAKA